MTTLATLATELIEFICEFAAEYAREDWEFSLGPDGGGNGSQDRKKNFVSRFLVGLPLIHPRWTVPDQKALYRYVCLTDAVRYKAFQESLTQYPHNGRYVRGLFIDWGGQDFGGPDGYSYKVLGWFHEMEIQQVVRLCPFVERFHPGKFSPVISQEGIAALGSIDCIRSIAWRRAEFQKYGDTVNRAQSSWRFLEAVEIVEHITDTDFKYVRDVSSRLRGLNFHNTQFELEMQHNRDSWSYRNLQELQVSMKEMPTESALWALLSTCGSNIITLSLPFNSVDMYQDIFSDVFKELTPRLQHLRLFVSPRWIADWSEQFQVPSRYYQWSQVDPLLQFYRNHPWRSESLRSVRIEFHGVQHILVTVKSAIAAFLRPEAFPNLRKVLKVQRDGNGELQITNLKNSE